MALVTFRLRAKRIPDVIERVRSILEKMVLNAADYPAPNPPVAVLSALTDTLEKSYQAALKGGTDKKVVMRINKKTLLANMLNLSGYVQMASKGDADKINRVAYIKGKAVSAGILQPPANVRAKYGIHEGEILLLWNGVKNRRLYHLQINPVPGDETKWQNTEPLCTTDVMFLATGLVSGKLYAFRIATISASGTGGWSDVAMHKAL